MLRRVLGSLTVVGLVLGSWSALSQSGPPGSSTPPPRDLLASAFRVGIVPAPLGTAGHYLLQQRAASASFSERGVDLRLSPRGQRTRAVGWSLVGARAVVPQAEKPREATLNRFVEERREWERDVPTYGGVRYPGVLPGVDLWFEERAEGVEYGFRAERGEALRRTRLAYDGARAVRVVEAGRALEVDLGDGVLREEGLRCEQEARDGSRYQVGCRFADARRVAAERWQYAIEVDVEAPDLPVVVDPVIVWSNYVGFDADEEFGDFARSVIEDTFSAHPPRVPGRKALYNFGIRHGRVTMLELYELPDGGAARHLGQVPLPGPTMIHDFIATERHLIFFVTPLRLKVFRMLLGMGSYSENLEWRPEEGTQVLVIPIDDIANPVRIETEPLFTWHFANAYERDGHLVVDYVRYPDFGINTWLRELAHGVPSTEAQGRYLGVHSGPVARRGLFDAVTKVDMTTGREERFGLGGEVYPTEPVFVPRAGATQEDDGYVLTQVYDAPSGLTHVAVLDARNPGAEPLARAWFEHALPITFHGGFMPSSPSSGESPPGRVLAERHGRPPVQRGG